MFVVIFRAKAAEQNHLYESTVEQLRELAFGTYGCIDFIAMTQGDEEIALSYWPDEASIKRWKQDASHLLAQKQGQKMWYKSYSVEVAEIKRSYSA